MARICALVGGVMTVVDDMNMKVREFYGSLNTLNIYLRMEKVMGKQMSWRGEIVSGKEFSRRLRKFYIFKYSNVQQYLSLVGSVLRLFENLIGVAPTGKRPSRLFQPFFLQQHTILYFEIACVKKESGHKIKINLLLC